MKNKIYNLIFLLAAVTLLTQCKEDTLLTQAPQDSPNAGNFFINASSARQAVTAAWFPLTSYWMWGDDYMLTYADILSDDAWLYGNRATNVDRNQWSQWLITPTTGYNVLNYQWWESFYQSINASSFAVDNIPNSSDPSFTPDQQKKYIGVAKMMRAFCYIYLTTLYGDIPLHKTFLNTVPEAFIAKSPRADVLKFAIEDLVYATANVPDSWSGSDQGLPVKAAAAGLLAKAYLYAKDWPNAVTAAQNAITIANTDGFALMDDYVTMMSEASQPNKEFIFAFQFMPSQGASPLSNQGITYRGVKDDPAYIQNLTYGPGFGYAVPTADLVNAFEPGDPRRKGSMWLDGDYFGIYHGATQVYLNPVTQLTTTYHEGDTIKYQNGWSFGNVNTRKEQSSVIGLTNVEYSGYDQPLLRYAELYLYAAEALIENGQIAEGMAQLNKVRARPSVHMPPLTATDQVDARTKLRHERRIELNMEGIRIFDLMRWGIMEDVFGNGTNPNKILGIVGNNTFYKPHTTAFPKNNVLPIPQQELDVNKNMTQNPGY